MTVETSNVRTIVDRPVVRCGCGKVIFDGDVVKSRIVKVFIGHTEAKCQCKSWVRIPLVYSEKRNNL